MANRIEILLKAILSEDSTKAINKQVQELQKQLDNIQIDNKLVEQLKQLEKIDLSKIKVGKELSDDIKKAEKALDDFDKKKDAISKVQAEVGFLFDDKKAIKDFEGVKKAIEDRGGTLKFDVDVKDGKNEITSLSATFDQFGKKVTQVFEKIEVNGDMVWDVTKLKNYDNVVKSTTESHDKLQKQLQKLYEEGNLSTEQFKKFNVELEKTKTSKTGLDKLANDVQRVGESSKHINLLQKEMQQLAIQGNFTDEQMRMMNKTFQSMGNIGKREYGELLAQIKQMGIETKRVNAQEVQDLKTRENLIKRLVDQQIKLERISRNKPKIQRFDEYGGTVEAINKLEIGKHVTDLKSFDTQVTKISQSLDMMSAKATEAGRTQVGIADSFKIAMEKFPVWMATTTVFYGSIRSAREFMSIIIDIDTKMTSLRKVMADNTDFGAVFDRARDSAERFGRTISETMDAYIEFAKQGYTGDELGHLADAATVMGNVADMTSQASAEYLTASLVQWKKDSQEAMDIADKWNQIANDYPTTAENIAQANARSASVARAMGVSFEELNGISATLTATMKQSGNEIG